MATSLQGFRSLIEHSPDVVSLIDAEGEILYGSGSATRIFGYQPEELVGRNCFDLMHPEDRDYARGALEEVLAKPPGPLQWDARVRHKDGNYSWAESTVSNLLFEVEVQAIVMHQRDIHARKAAEVERQIRAEELALSNLRLEEFAYTAAHDLREPLRAMCGFTAMLVQRTQMDANTREMAQFIVEGAARMTTLVDGLLAFAKAGAHQQLRSVDLRQAVAQALKNLALEIEASGAMVTVDRLPFVQGEEIHLVRLFQNLISNSVRYRSKDPVVIYVTAERRGLDWLVRIKDNGVGIAPENHAHVFVPFNRVPNPDVSGTGLGLAVCKKIVEGFGGAIWVESELGAGSTLCFTIAKADADLSAPVAGPPAPA